MEEGYLLRAIGKDVYFDMCLCLAASLRKNGDRRPISVFTDNPNNLIFRKFYYLWDQVIDLNPHVEGLRKKFNRDFLTGFEFGGLAPRLLCRLSPYNKTISIDGDMMAITPTDRMWGVFESHHITFLGCRRMFPGWGSMSAEELTAAEIQIEDDISKPNCIPHISLREVHGGIMWWDKSECTEKVLAEFDSVILSGKLYSYFPKVVDLWWGHLSDEVVYAYVMSVLDLPVIPYNSNIMGSNPEFFSVEEGKADMGHFMTNPRLKDHMIFTDGVPVLVHFFAKDKDPNYDRNKQYLYGLLESGALR